MRRVIRNLPSRMRGSLVDIVYPRTCAVCGQRGTWVCDMCVRDSLPLLPELCCDRCGHPVIMGRCECRMMHPAIVKARAMMVYDGWITNAVRAMKYERERDRLAHIAERMEPALADLGSITAMIPVPLHPNRRAWRGFNQAELLAEHLGRNFSIPVEDGLLRVKETETQTHSSREDRLSNMEGAFVLNPKWTLDPAAHYVLLDDVYTTGATLGACAEVLDIAGANRISVVTIAFDLQKRDLAAYRDMVRSVLSV